MSKKVGLTLLAVVLLGLPLCFNLVKAKEKQVTIRVCDFQLTVEPTATAMNKIIDEFEKEYPNIKVEREPVPLSQVSLKYVTQARANQAPDVVRAQDYWVSGWHKDGYLLDLKSFIDREGGSRYKKQFFDNTWKLVDVGKGTYGIPAWSSFVVLTYNKKIFKEAGLSELDPNKPITWAEFLEIAKKVNQPEKGIWAYGMHGSNQQSAVTRFLTWLYNNGTDVLNKNNTKSLLDEEKAIEALKFWSELATKYKLVPPGPTDVAADEARTLLAQRRVAMIQSPVQALDEIIVKNPSVKSELSMAPMPSNIGKSYSPQFSTYWVISKKTKNAEAAWKFVEFFSRKQSQVTIHSISRMTPSRKDALEDPIVQKDITGKVALSMANNSLMFPTIPQWSQITNILGDAMQAPLVGASTPEQSFKKAANSINKLLSSK